MTVFHPAVVAIAQAVHEEYELLAPMHGYKTRDEPAVPWDEVPFTNRHLMCAVVDRLLARGVIQVTPSNQAESSSEETP